MFTGLIQSLGEVISATPRNQGMEFTLRSAEFADSYVLGESIACDGCCLTVEKFAGDTFTVFASPETLRLTGLGHWSAGEKVNLERALQVGDRLGGHLVSGHVDGLGSFREAINRGDSWEIWINAPEKILNESISKGSITVDGISLTLVELTEDAFSLWIIPETWERTTLSLKKEGDSINLESDMIGKYVRKSLSPYVSELAEGKLDEIVKKFSS